MQPITQGENWTVYNADALEYLAEIEGQGGLSGIRAVVTDPPYMINTKSDGMGKLSPWADIINGAAWYSRWMAAVKSVLPNNGCLWTYLNWRSLPTFSKALCDARWSFASMLVWDKDWIGPAGKNQLRPRYEMIGLCAMSAFELPDRNQPDIRVEKWCSMKPTGHPAEKPVALMRHLIEISTDPGDLILDPFMGSGTTGVAALEAGRRFIGVEMDGQWAHYAANRIAQTAS